MTSPQLNNYNFILGYLICLVPLSIMTGPFLPDLIVTLVSMLFLFVVIKNKKFEYFANNFFLLFFLLYLYLVLSSLLSEFPIHSLKSSLPYIRFIFFSLAVYYILNEDNKFLKKFNYFLIYTFLIALLFGYYQFFNGTNFYGISSVNNYRLTLPFNDRMIIGSFLIRLTPLLITLIAVNYVDNNKKFYILVSLLFSIFILVFLSGERSAILLTFVLSIYLLFYLPISKIYKLSFLLIVGISVLLLLITSSTLKERNLSHTLNQLGLNKSFNRIHLFSNEHEQLYTSSLLMFLDKPFTGIGPNNFRNLCERNEFTKDGKNGMSCSTHPHNSYLQILSETGLFGLIIYLIIFLKILQRFFNHGSKNPVLILLFGCFIITLWPIVPTLNVFNNWINIIYYLPVGFYLYYYNQYKVH